MELTHLGSLHSAQHDNGFGDSKKGLGLCIENQILVQQPGSQVDTTGVMSRLFLGLLKTAIL